MDSSGRPVVLSLRIEFAHQCHDVWRCESYRRRQAGGRRRKRYVRLKLHPGSQARYLSESARRLPNKFNIDPYPLAPGQPSRLDSLDLLRCLDESAEVQVTNDK